MKSSKGRDLKPHIGIFGRRNAGKSSFINVLVNQEVAIVSDHPGTTTDPVRKSMEIFGIGPAVLVDTAGIDDTGELGRKRVARSLEVLKTVDCAVLLIAGNAFGPGEEALIEEFRKWDVPFLIVHNKSDLEPLGEKARETILGFCGKQVVPFSVHAPLNLEEVIAQLGKTIPENAYRSNSLLGDLVGPGDYVLLITPIDMEAPEGRMILPQVAAIRDVLEHDGINIVMKEDQVEAFFREGRVKPALAVTDSQVFGKMKDIVPREVPFTSFSILFARQRGEFKHYLSGTPAIDRLKDGDRVLVLESCTHQVNCDDIGRFKLPAWMEEHTGRSLQFDFVSGLNEIASPMISYALVLQCGGCMVTRKQLGNRLRPALELGIPVTNYGLAIAWMNGIFERATAPFTEVCDADVR